MKPSPLVLVVSALALALSGLVAPPARAANPKARPLIDFTNARRERDGTLFRCYEYTYQDWGNNRVKDLPPRGTLVQAPTGKGGIGENKTMVKFDGTPAAELNFIIGNENNARLLNFALEDADGTEQQWRISLDGRPKGRPLVHRLDLAKPDTESKAGKQPGLNLKKVRTWQVRGDYSDANVEVLLVKLMPAP